MMEISLKAEKIMQIGSVPITNTILASTFLVLILIGVSLKIKGTGYDLKSRFYNLVEMAVEGFLSLIEGVTNDRKLAKMIFPVIVTFFLFIILNNWFGIAPGVGSIGFFEPKEEETETVTTEAKEENGNLNKEVAVKTPTEENSEEKVVKEQEEVVKKGETEKEETVFIPLFRSANSDLNMTLAIALFSVLFIQIIAIKTVGLKPYLHKFFNFSNPILLFVGMLEIISELVKIFSFSFRLFGNIFAGDVLLIVIYGLVPYVAPIPFLAIELFAGSIQALIFSMLTLVFIKTSVSHEAH